MKRLRASTAASSGSLTRHRLTDHDAQIVAAARTQLAPFKGQLKSPASRELFDGIMDQVPDAPGVSYERGEVGSVPSVLARPEGACDGAALLHLHGGAFVLGSAWAYRHFAGQIAACAGIISFIPDYRLAPEHGIPAAFEDALAAFRALGEIGCELKAIVGDSAGGGLAAAVLAAVLHDPGTPVAGGVLLSPWFDLTLSGASLDALAAQDPMVTRDMLAATAHLYLAGADLSDPRVSPLFGRVDSLPPLQLHVGGDEVLLDDARLR